MSVLRALFPLLVREVRLFFCENVINCELCNASRALVDPTLQAQQRDTKHKILNVYTFQSSRASDITSIILSKTGGALHRGRPAPHFNTSARAPAAELKSQTEVNCR